MAEYIFVAIPSRVGTKTLTGPKTGKEWVIRPSGSWIDMEDIALLDAEIPYYCWKARGFIYAKIKEVVPDLRQLATKPT